MKTLTTFILIISLFCSTQAQTPCDTNSIFPLSALQITDIEGNCYDATTLSLPTFSNQPIPSGTAGRFLELNTGIYRAGIFILYFDDILDTLDGNNFNFYPNNSNATALALGLSRIELVCRVYEDLSYLLNTNPWGLANDKCVRIEVKESTVGMPSSTLATASTFFVEMNIPQFAHGMVAKTVISGQDAWLNLSNYNPSWVNMPHGTLQVNFGGVIDYDIWANVTLAVGKTHKLYSVILHEATHSLGFSSAIDATGWSRMANTGTPLVFNRFDKFLTKNGQPFPPRTADANGNITAILQADLTGLNCDSVLFMGNLNSNQNIYIGSSFVVGTSLSHFGCTLSGTNYVMQGGLSSTSYNMRFDTAEVNTLCDLGYTTTTVFGQDTITNDSSANTFAYYPACGSCVVIGNHDILNALGQPFEVCRAGGVTSCITPNMLSIPINHLLSNDNTYNNNATGIDTFGILVGGGTLVMNGISNSLVYTATSNFSGWAILYYIPTNGICSGNPTYILIYVYPPNNMCEPNAQSLCNFVCNGNFENYASQIPQPQTSNYTIATFAANYYAAIGGSTPDFYLNPAPNSAATGGAIKALPSIAACTPGGPLGPLTVNNNSVFMGLIQVANCSTGEAYHFPLHTSLETGKTYKIKMLVANKCLPTEVFAVLCKNPPITGNITKNDIRTYFPPAYSASQAYDNTNLPCVYSPIPGSPTTVGVFNSSVEARETIRIPFPKTSSFNLIACNLIWTTIEDTFMVGSNDLDNLIIHIAPNSPGYYFFDDVEIYEIGTNQYNVSALDTVIACSNGNILIPYIISADTSNVDTIAVDLTASLPSLLGFGFSGIGDFSNTGQLNTPLLLAPGQMDTVYLNLIVSNSSGTITMAANSVDTNSCLGVNSPPTASTFINVASASLLVNINQIDMPCIGAHTGAASANVFGGVAPYSYMWSNGQTTIATTGLSAGNYTITVIDANNCLSISSITIVENNLSLLNALSINILCNGENTGAINITASGGTTPYAYLWNDGSTSEDRTGLSAGIYQVTITDNNGCTTTTTQSITLTEPTVLSATNTSTHILCNGANTGAIDITASGGTTPYTYLWNDGTSAEDRTGLIAGTYQVTITDDNGCTTTQSITLIEPTVLSATNAPIHILCNGANTGAIDITSSGGATPYTYLWNDGTTTNNRTGLVAGTYQVTITDNNGCTTTQSITLTEPTVLSANNVPTHVLCNGANTGAIDITASGGAIPYAYLWNDGTITKDRTGLIAGTYQVTITDNNGCITTQNITITEPSALSVTIAQGVIPCGTAATGTATITALGGVGGYTYLWDNNANNQTSSTATGLTAGTYQATITDANGCTISANVVLVSNALPTVSIIPNNITICEGESIDLTATGATTFQWSTGQNGAIINVSPQVTTSYSVTGTDNNGCENTATALVNVIPTLTLSFSQEVIPIPNTNTVEIRQTVCATGIGSVNYSLENIVPQGWQPSQPTINDFIAAGDCNITSFILQLMDNADLCNIGVVNQATLIPQSSCITVVQDYLPINTAYIQLPTLIPPTITTFTQAISLPDPLLVSGNSQSIVLQGNITQDQGTFVFAGGSEIQLCPSVQLSVAANADLRLFSTHAHATAFPGQLWRSITVEPGGSLLVTRDITHPSTMLIEDALYGIEVLSNATANSTVRVQKAIFNRNHIGIYAPQQPQTNASNILLEANTFDCSSALLPAPWATQAIDNWSFAGVEVNNFLFLNVLDGNTFRNLTNGIVAKSSDVTVTRSWFKNIQPRTFYTNQQMPSGNGIYIESPKERVVHQLFQKGWGASANDLATFENCYNGIVGIRTKMQVESNRMTNVGRWGICSQLAISAQSVWIYRNRIEVPNYSKAIAINLLQNTSKVQVHDNVLLVGLMTANNEAAGGILVNNQGASQDLHIMRNTIELYKGGAGISLTSVSALAPNVVNVSANTIDFRLSAQGQPNNQNAIHRNGIVANNCFGVELSCNTITSNLSMAGGGLSTPNNPNIFRNAIGINVNNSVVRVNCNTMFRTDTGLRFLGNCNGAEVRANSFKMHRIGLLYESNTDVGDQQDMGNLWYGNFPAQNGGGGAVNNGLIQNNRYFVSNTPPPPFNVQYMPPNATPGWFNPLSNGSQESCNTTPCPVISPLLSLSVLNSTDIAIVNNQLPQTPLAFPWGLRKGLYHKLDKNPILRLNAAMGQFYNTYQTQPIAAVVAATDAQENAIAVDSTIVAQSQQYYSNMANLLDSIKVVDSLYVEGQNSNQSWQMQRTAHLQQYAQMVQNQVSVLSSALSQIVAQNQQAQSINANIIPSNTPEQNEQIVNEIYLQTVAMGDNVFSASQKQTLYDIAHQCPELGGNAVYRARSIYALVEHEDYNTNCNYLPQTRMASLDTCHEDVNFPNPSLEGTPGFNAAPNDWVICESTPDIHPFFEQRLPSDSVTYAGQAGITYTFSTIEESFGCQLQDSVVKGMRYKFSFDVAKGQSETLGAFSMWLGNTPCSKEQMVHWGITYDSVWNKRFVEFIPNESYLYFIISAERYDPVVNYHIIDNLRPVVCDTIDTVVTPPIDTFHIAPYHEHTEYGEDILVGVEEISIERFNIYPNPNTQGQLTVEWGNPLPPSKIVLIDALGRQVGQYDTSAGETMQMIDIHLLASGYYTVVLQNDRQVFARGKLIIAKP